MHRTTPDQLARPTRPSTTTRVARRMAGLLVLACTTLWAVGATTAGAGVSPGAFNTGTCYSSSRAITQSAEVYRTANEYVSLQGAVVRSGDNFTVYTPWQAGQNNGRANTQAAYWNYSSMPSGSYVMWMRYAVYSGGAWSYSGWYQVATTSAGTAWYAGISFGGSSVCRI